jgi:hypothetical protein
MSNLFFIGAVVLVLIFGGAGCRGAEEVGYDTETSKPTAPAVAKAQLVGGWNVTSGAGFEEITLHADGTYSTFLYQKPFIDGTWTLVGNTLSLTATPDPALSASYTVQSLANGTLTMKSGSTPAVWKKIQ